MISVREFVTPDSNPQDTTAGFQKAIDAAAEQGGATVRVPIGAWMIGTIFLRSGITLHLDYGAVVKACPDMAIYPNLGRGHNKSRQPYHTIHAQGCEHITIEGQGTIDGQGMDFWHAPKPNSPWYRANQQRVTPLVNIQNSRDVTLRDFTIKDSPGWTVHTYNCDYVTIRGITIDNHLYGPNTDGLDINGCRDVFVSDCYVSGGDDAIILKATDDARSCERVVVTNCVTATNCGALGLGAECTHSIRDVAFSNCVVKQALRMIAIEMWTTGTIENVVFNNISGRTMTQIPLERPIYIDIQQHGRPESALGTLRNVLISNFAATTRGRIVLTAQDGAVLENITLRDVHLTYPEIEDPAVTVPAGTSNQMSNYSPESRAVRAALVADNVHGLQVYNLLTSWPDRAEVPMHGLWGRNVERGVVDSPYLCASQPGTKIIVVKNSEVDVRAPCKT
jgi:polygalacturonase